MYKITSFIAIIALAAMSFSTQAQEIDQKPGKKNELAVDFSDVFTPNPSPGLIYKRHFAKGAFRTRLNLNTFGDNRNFVGLSGDTSIAKIDVENSVRNFSWDLFVGYQWNKRFSDKLNIIFGVEAYLGYLFSELERESVSLNNSNAIVFVDIDRQELNSTRLGLAPFIGFRYHLNEAFAVGIESVLLA